MNIEKINNDLVNQRAILNMRLERLRDNKEREIAEYIQNEVLSKPGFVGYEAVRKDLEKAYLDREFELETQIKVISEQIEKNKSKLEDEEKRIVHFDKNEIEDSLINYKNSGYRQNAYGYYFNVNTDEYDADYRPWEDPLFNLRLNKAEEKEIHGTVGQESTQLSTELELDNEESEIAKEQPTEEKKVELEQEELEKPIALNEENDDLDEFDLGTPISSTGEKEEIAKETSIGNKLVEFENICDMVEKIYDDVIDGIKKARTIRLEENELLYRKAKAKEYQSAGTIELEKTEIELPNGTYINEKDIVNAFQNYRKKNKGRIFTVKGFNEKMQITRKSIRKFKKKLRECSIISLVREKKLSIFDIKRVYGKEKADDYANKVQIGSNLKAHIASGNYVNFDEIIGVVNEVFIQKSPSWIEKLKQKISERKNRDVTPIIEEPENMEFDDIKNLNLNQESVEELESMEFDDIKEIDLKKVK